MRVRRAVAAVPVLLALLAGCTSHHDTYFRFHGVTKRSTLIPVPKRRPAGPVHGDLMFGGTYRLAQDRGKVVVLNFWASDCGPCRIESPELDTFYRAQKAQGVRLIGVDVKDDPGGARDFVQQEHLSYPIVVDQPARTAIELGDVPVNYIPDTVVIDRKGRVAALYAGVVQPADLTPVITTLLAEPA